MAQRPLKRSHAILIVAGLAALTTYNIVRVTREPPKFDTLSAHDVVLQDRVEVQHHTGRRSMRSPYAILKTDGARVTIENLCFLWHCELSPALVALHAGDHLRIWTSGNEIWQVNHDGELLLDYRQALAAHDRSATRQEWVYAALALALVAMIAWVFLRRRAPSTRRGVMVSTETAARGTAPVRLSFRIDGGKTVRSSSRSVTINQHALAGPLLERFQDAARRRDRDAMVAALVASGASETGARLTADAILAKPTHVVADS